MRTRAARVSVVAVLLAVGIGAAFVAWDNERRIVVLDGGKNELDARIDHLSAALAEIRIASGGYVAPGQPDSPWLQRASALLEQVPHDITALAASSRSADSASRLKALRDSATALGAADARIREHLKYGDDLMAAAVIFGEEQEIAGTMATTLSNLRQSEDSAYAAARSEPAQWTWLARSAAAVVWTIGLLLLVPRSGATPAPVALTIIDPTPDAAIARDEPEPVRVDFNAAADLCTALSRLDTSAALPALLAQAAALVDAAGLIVWMADGDDLRAVAAHGYDPAVLGRVGTISRTANNATAAAWTTGELRTVPGDPMSYGAIVAPMFAPAGCIGVLAAEVRHGREQNAGTRAVTQMIAAQLATIVAAWPAAVVEPGEIAVAADPDEQRAAG